MKREAKISILTLILFIIFVPMIPVSTTFPPPMATRNWHCVSCPMMAVSKGYASISYVLTGSNLGSMDVSNHLYIGACMPLKNIPTPCAAFGMINPEF